MRKLQFKNADESELDINQAVVSSFQQSRKEALPHQVKLDSHKMAKIDESKDSVSLRSTVQEKDVDQPSLASKYARVISCSFEQEKDN
jgi:formyltetrahydrofolate hydrolase